MAAPANIRQMNRRDILSVLMRTQTSTRSELARVTGLSQPTTGKIVEDLIAEGVLQTATAIPAMVGRMGRPGFDIALNSKKPYFLAVQLGVIHTRLAALSVAPPPSDRWDGEFSMPTSFPAWVKATVRHAQKLLTPSMKAVLVSVPGVFNEITGQSILSPNLRWLEGQNISEALQEKLGLPVIAVQEMHCLALGHFAIDQTADSFLLVDFGNGVGSCPVIRGRLLDGKLPLSGELGHTPVPGNTLKCGCGGVGCLETLIRRERLLKTLGIDVENWHDGWANYVSRLKPGALPERFKAAFQSAAIGIAGALNVLGLDRVIITGYLSELPEHAIRILSDGIQEAAVAGRLGMVKTSVAPRRRLAGLANVGIDRFLAPATS